MIKIPSRVFFLLEGQCFYSIFTSTCPSLQEYPLNLNSTSNFHCIQPQSHQKSTKSPWHHLAKSFKMIHQRHFHSSVWLSIKFSRFFQIYFIKNKKWSKQCSVYLTRKKKETQTIWVTANCFYRKIRLDCSFFINEEINNITANRLRLRRIRL